MEKPDPLRELFRMQKTLHERIGVKMNGREGNGCAVKNHDDSSPV